MFKKLNEKLESIQLNEMSMAWTSKQNNRCVWVENPSGHNNKYFKYLDGITYGKAEKVARISLLKPEYINHNNIDGKQDWILNNKEKKELVMLMNAYNNLYRDYNCTNWQATLITYNRDNFGLEHYETINGFDEQEYPDAFNINTIMPNYMLL